jgi:hypothetical protein
MHRADAQILVNEDGRGMKEKMTRILIGLFLIAIGIGAHAQNTFPSSGNVGIGTTTPASNLDVIGVGRFTSTLTSNGFGGGSASGFLVSSAGAAYGWMLPGEPTDQKLWDAFASGTGLQFRAVNDANSAANVWMQINRGSGFTIGSVTFPNGNIGIGTTNPTYRLDVAGAVHASGAITASGGVTFPDGSTQTSAYNPALCGGDYAESVDVTGERTKYEPGDVLVIDPGAPGKFLKAGQAYSALVAGIYSTKPGFTGRRQTSPKSPDEVPMAMIGIVPTKVSAENGSIKPGDLLVASSTLGHAMKGTDRSQLTGAVIGKALGSLDSGTGVIEVLVTLQ